MAFSSGIATDQDDLLDKLRAFALAQGWTINSFANDTSTYDRDSTSGKRLHISKNGMYFNMRSSDGANVFDVGTLINTNYWRYWRLYGIAVNGSTGYSGASSWENQPGAPQVSATGIGTTVLGINNASVNYWLFSTTESLTMAVEYDPVNYAGYMQYIHVGRIIPSGSILTTPGVDGAVYMSSASPNVFLNDLSTPVAFYNALNQDSGNFTGLGTSRYVDWGRGGVFLPSVVKGDGTTLTNKWYLVNDSNSDRMQNDIHISAQAVPPNADEGMIRNLVRRTPNSETGVTPLFPIYLLLTAQGGVGGNNSSYRPYRFAGVVDGVLNAAHTGFSLAGTSTIASDTYSHFPMWHVGQSKNSGLAIKQ